jgi:hypothetical protein
MKTATTATMTMTDPIRYESSMGGLLDLVRSARAKLDERTATR